MAIRAAREGAKISVKSRVVGLEREGDGWCVIVKHLDEEYAVKTKIVIAADGV